MYAAAHCVHKIGYLVGSDGLNVLKLRFSKTTTKKFNKGNQKKKK